MQLTIVAFFCLFFPFAFAIKRFFFLLLLPDAVLTARITPSLLAAGTGPVLHSRPSCSCEAQTLCTSSARPWSVPPPRATPAAAADAADVRPGSWSPNIRAKLWSWVPFSSKVRIYLNLFHAVPWIRKTEAQRNVVTSWEKLRLSIFLFGRIWRREERAWRAEQGLSCFCGNLIQSTLNSFKWNARFYSTFLSFLSHYLIKCIIERQAVCLAESSS